jgi:probable addiction module antidote protein
MAACRARAKIERQVNVRKMTPKAFIAKYRDNPKAIAKYLNDALREGDGVLVTKAIGIMVRAQGVAEVSQKAGQRRDSLYRMFDGRNGPALPKAIAVLHALDIQLIAKPSASRSR